MMYEVLGPLRVIDGEDSFTISARKIETVLAALVVRCDRVVASDQLITEIWADAPPRRATAGLHVYVSQVRKLLNRPGRTANPLLTRMSGYELNTEDDEIDFRLFLEAVERGRALMRERRDEEAVACLEGALNLWRGPVLGDLRGGPIIEGFVTWMTELRLECLEALADTYLRLGRHRELIGRLHLLVSENPLREAYYAQLMLALYRSDRQAEALSVYQSARSMLMEELGLEPCQALQDLQRAIFTADAGLDLRAAS
ncbi:MULTISPECIES: AfsR/SARP family transcriptional regulator [Actinomadura]|uniref:Activator protein n=1 Tax=Actinomadura litoris TaxID=2678616 RepID=A0A7K1KVJ3_9ACTN|nr:MULTISPECIES: AfsR/SARP family transcriptional regulator [Actinomadura]MBT2211294.1 AfsR/SARP family transcriptional regulator [Actinomadura sp. NEAU-AAG7]MUN36208.1 activator protein [Actinomadura litoris]